MESAIDIKTVTEKIRSGDTASFELLYRAEVNRVFAFVSYRVNDRETAKEVTQDCFVELYRALSKFTYQSDAAFYAFLFTIVRRTLAGRYALMKRHAVSEFHEDAVAALDSSPAAQFEVRSALETLDDVSREIVVLHHWSRYTFAEIAALINMTESAVRVRHHRARAVLKDALTK